MTLMDTKTIEHINGKISFNDHESSFSRFAKGQKKISTMVSVFFNIILHTLVTLYSMYNW